MTLPLDPTMLLSVVNTNLRDRYDSLETFCKEENLDINDIQKKLAAIDYYYEKSVNQFK